MTNMFIFLGKFSFRFGFKIMNMVPFKSRIGCLYFYFLNIPFVLYNTLRLLLDLAELLVYFINAIIAPYDMKIKVCTKNTGKQKIILDSFNNPYIY